MTTIRRLVIDAGVAIKWVIPEDGSTHAAALRSQTLHAPDLLLAECGQVLWRQVRRRALSRDEARSCFIMLRRSPIKWSPIRKLTDDAVVLATEIDHSAYDCPYLVLALRLSIPLVTADAELAKAAKRDARIAKLVAPLAY